MKNKWMLLLPILILGAAFVGGTYYYKASQESKAEANRVPLEQLVKPDSHFIGPEDAKVVMVEFLDPECSACAAYFPMVKGLVSEYKDRIKFVVRYMKLHGHSREAAMAAEAAGLQGKYWEMLAQLFYRKEWVNQDKPRFDIFEDIAKNLNLDLEKFKKDSLNEDFGKKIDEDHLQGKALAIPGTPTIFINGKMISEISYEKLKDQLNIELSKIK